VTSDELAVLDQIDPPLIGAAIARLAGRLLAAPAPDADDAALLTPDDVARLLRVSKKAVYARGRELGAVRIGRRLRFPRKAVDRFVARRRT